LITTVEIIQGRLEELRKRRAQALASVNACIGAIEELERLVAAEMELAAAVHDEGTEATDGDTVLDFTGSAAEA